MHWQLNPYGVLLLITALLSWALAAYAWRQRRAPGATSLALLGLAAGLWSFAYGVATGFQELGSRVLWAKVQYLGIVLVPVAMFLFAVQYTGRERWLKRPVKALLFVIPALTLVLVWTNEAHGLIWSQFRVTTFGSLPALEIRYGTFFWLFAAYAYGLLLVSTVLLATATISSSRLQRRQSLFILGGALLPWFGNLLYLAGMNPIPYLDLTPFLYGLSCLLFAVGVFHYRLLDLVPVARDQVVESMHDGVLVLDDQDRIVDANPAALRLLDHPSPDIVGQHLDDILPSAEELAVEKLGSHETHLLVPFGTKENRRYVDLFTSPLRRRRKETTGRLVVARDVTERTEAEAELQRYAERLKTLTEIGQSILAARLPETIAVAAIRRIHYLVPCQRALVLSVGGTRQISLLAAESGGGVEAPAGPEPYLELVSIPALKKGWVLGVADLDTLDTLSPLQQRLHESGVRSYVVAPLYAREELIGLLSLESIQPHAFGPDHVAIATEVAGSLTVAIRQVRLYERAQQEIAERLEAERALRDREQFLATLNEITGAALETPDLPTMLQTLADRMGELFDADGCYLVLWDEDARMPVPAAAYGQERDTYRTVRPESGEATVTAAVLDAGRSLALEDVRQFPIVGPRIAGSSRVRSLLALSLIADDRKLGAVLIAYNKSHQFSPEEVSWGEQAAAHVALALAKGQLVKTLQEYVVELQARNEELDAFSHTVAHDLKNPITTILSYVDLLRDEYAASSPELMQDVVDTMTRHGLKMSSIIDELLLLSSVRSMEEVSTRLLDMDSIVADALRRLQPMLLEHEAEMHQPGSWPGVIGYAPWVEEVWVNYISNAVKYGGRPPQVEMGYTMETGGMIPSKEHSTPLSSDSDRQQTMVCFWVRDNGPGLSAEQMARLFTPFERLHQQRAQGHGLGLSIVERIVHRLGGQVGVKRQGKLDVSESHEPEQGSTFYFTLPLAPDLGEAF